MFCKFIFIVFILFSTEVNFISGQDSSGTSCTTPAQSPGTCVDINDCPSLLNLLTTQSSNNTVRGYLRRSVCEYVGRSPIVCCPRQDRRIESVSSRISLPKSPNCGFSNATTPKVVNGVPAKLGEFPWLVALGYRNSKNPALPRWLCGGSLITNRHILTAAHCVFNRSDLYVARLGDLDLFSDDDGATPSTIPISIGKVKIHSAFNQLKYTNDIAILTLERAVDNPTVWPICLPTDEPYRSMNYLNFNPTLAGWGSASFNGPSSSFLQEIFVPVLNNQVCERTFGKAATIDENIICAGSLNGDKDACGGDSGGPLMHEINEGRNMRAYQIGIVSYGFRCATPGFPGVYTRVTAFLDWIQANLN